MDEVLQTTTIFSNVSKGVLAKREDLLEAFGTDDEVAICKIILADGELQVSDKERKVELDTLFRDVASILSEKCINPDTNRPYTISMLERALRDVHYSVDPKRPAKTQALEALPLLQSRFPIERARMRLHIVLPVSSREEVHELMTQRGAVIEELDLQGNGMLSMRCLVDPGAFRAVHALVQAAGGGSRVDVVSLAATAAGEGDVDLHVATAMDTLRFSSRQESARTPAAPQNDRNAVGSSAYVGLAHTSLGVPPLVRRQTETSAASLLYPRGPVSALPEEHASRKERFAELDTLQPGWTVELRSRGEGAPVDAIFFSPSGERVGAFAMARRMALHASKESGTARDGG